MKKSIINPLFHLLSVITVSLILVGCNRSEDKTSDVDAHEDHDHTAVETQFIEGKGVQLSKLGRVSVGLETAEVEESTQSSSKALTLQVFRHAGESGTSSGQYRQGYAYASVILPANQVSALKPGQPFTVSQDGEEFEASVLEIDRQLEPVTGEAEIIVEILDSENRLNIGSFAKGNLKRSGQSSEDLVSIPKEAVLKTARGEFAYVVNSEFFYRAPIKVKGETQDQVLISDGLFEGDIVASRGVQQLYLIELQTTNGGQGCAHGH